MTIDEYVKNHQITMTAHKVSRNPNMNNEESARWMDHFRVTLAKSSQEWQTYFSQGRGITEQRPKPSIVDVLDCLASDAATIENGEIFEDWASDLGYDTDSRSAEQTYLLIRAQAHALEALLGKSAYQQLLREVERL